MLRLNKKTEYALLALRYMSRQDQPDLLASAKEIASFYNIPEMLLAKVLQVLKRADLVDATKGSAGGYRLRRGLDAIPLLSLLDLFNEQVQLVDCLGDDHGDCQQLAQCDIRGPLNVLNDAIMNPLSRMTVRDLFTEERPAAPARTLSIFR